MSIGQHIFILIYATDDKACTHVLLGKGAYSVSTIWVIPWVSHHRFETRDITAGRTAEELALATCIDDIFTSDSVHLIRTAEKRASPPITRDASFFGPAHAALSIGELTAKIVVYRLREMAAVREPAAPYGRFGFKWMKMETPDRVTLPYGLILTQEEEDMVVAGASEERDRSLSTAVQRWRHLIFGTERRREHQVAHRLNG